MTDPLTRLKALMGGEGAFVHAEANAISHAIGSSHAESGYSLLDDYESSYIDPAEHDRVDSQEILKSLLLSDDNIGKTAPHDMLFTPFWTVKNIAIELTRILNPNRNSASLKTLSDFWTSEWSLYHLSSRFAARPLILIPSDEAKLFLHKVQVYDQNELRHCDTRIPSISKFNYLFDNPKLPRPRYLGQIRSKSSFDILDSGLLTGTEPLNIKATTDEAKFIKNAGDDAKLQSELDAFQKVIETICVTSVEGYSEESLEVASVRTDWKAKKVATRNSNFSVTKERWCSSLKRTQRYLGLRATNDPRSTAGNGSITDESIFDYDSTQRYIFDLDVIFISLDIEADEMDTDLVTEIGLAALDTRDIRNVATGLSGETWIKMVTGKHFRIAERAHIRNHVYVEGNPLNFDERFGKSEIVPLSSIAAKVKACFEIRDTTLVESASREPNLRNIVLVGHNIKSDIKWLYKIDVDILNVNNLVEVLATEDLQKALKHDQRGGTSLARLLQEMEIDAWNLHNAGNDAAYTLQALVAMALRSISIARPIVGLEDRIREAQIKAREDVETEWNAWDAAERRSKDGKIPVPYRSSVLRG